MKTYGDIDSKFRFVILAAKRAKELLRGAKPKVETKSKNPIRIAQDEVTQNVVEYEIIKTPAEEVVESEEEVFDDEELEEELEESSEESPVEEEAEKKEEEKPAEEETPEEQATKNPKKKKK